MRNMMTLSMGIKTRAGVLLRDNLRVQLTHAMQTVCLPHPPCGLVAQAYTKAVGMHFRLINSLMASCFLYLLPTVPPKTCPHKIQISIVMGFSECGVCVWRM
jgi:hypothetical protein